MVLPLIPIIASAVGWLAGDLISFHYTGNDIISNIYGLIVNGKLPDPMIQIGDIDFQLVVNWIDGMSFTEFAIHLWYVWVLLAGVCYVAYKIATPKVV